MEPIHKRLMKKVQAVLHPSPVTPENQGATSLKKPYKISIPKVKKAVPKAKKTILRNE